MVRIPNILLIIKSPVKIILVLITLKTNVYRDIKAFDENYFRTSDISEILNK